MYGAHRSLQSGFNKCHIEVPTDLAEEIVLWKVSNGRGQADDAPTENSSGRLNGSLAGEVALGE